MQVKHDAHCRWQSLFGGVEIPSVHQEDLRWLWLRLQELSDKHKGETGISYHMRLFQDCVEHDSDPLAVCARVTILTYLEVTGLLDGLQLNGDIPDVVYRTAAQIPLPLGMQSFKPDRFLEMLEDDQ